jgi:predicted Zn-dependent protease
MRSTATLLLLFVFVCAAALPARPYTLQFNAAGTIQIKWPTTTITFAFSSSLNSPPANIRAGSDVVGAARRALQRWSEVSNLQFNVVNSGETTVRQDGVSLITVSQLNGSLFNSVDQPGRARVFSGTNAQGSPPFFPITEADVAINPNAQFSTDGTFNTFDLETTFIHEIGHALGLEHSGLCGAVMQPRQARNGTFALPALRRRVLSDDDRAGIRAIYGPLDGLGELRGTVRNAGGQPFFGAHVWAEDVTTGRAVAGNITLPNGTYSIRALPPAQYRVIVEPLNEPVLASEIPSRNGAYQGLQGPIPDFRTLEVGTATVSADATTNFNVNLNGLQPAFNPRFVGLNGRLSTLPVQVVPGRTFTLYLGGDNLHSIASGSDIRITSSYFSVNASSLLTFTFQGPSGPVQVLAVDVTASVVTAPGDYSVRLARRNAGTGAVEELAYLSGALTVDLPNGVEPGDPNLIDNTRFFVAQHYRDFLSREPDAGGLQHWSNEIDSCATNTQCRQIRRINVSAAFFLSIEFQETGYFVYRLYQAAFGDLPGRPVPVRFNKFFADTQRIGRGVVVGQGDWPTRLAANKNDFVLDLVTRADFLARHPATLSPEQFVDALNANAGGVLDADERQNLISQLSANNTPAGRASVLRQVADDADLVRNELNAAFVLMQYFGYLRRNPDDVGFDGNPDPQFLGFNHWLDKLNDFNGNFVNAEMVKAFIESIEYRQRFGQ